MIIEIDDYKTIDDLQQKFSECFPLLKLEFYAQPHHWYESSEEKKALSRYSQLDQIRKNHTHGFYEFFSQTRTGSFESELRDKYGLHVQIFRKQFGKWQQTTDTDQLTLGEQQNLALMHNTH